MADGDTEAEEPDGRVVLPRADRVWRHPTEVAAEARAARAARRTRRRRRIGLSVVGVAAAASLVWFTRTTPGDVTVTADLVPRASNAVTDPPATSLIATMVQLDDAPADAIVVRGAESGETLAMAVLARDGYLITSGQAVAGATTVVVSWDDTLRPGTVIGIDPATDIAVIRLDEAPAAAADRDTDAAVRSGDLVRLGRATTAPTRSVVEPMSSTALVDGAPLVGVVELEGRIGEITPGSPAYDIAGDLVGVMPATAESAPAAVVPIGVARAVADDIIAAGWADHPQMGVKARTNDADTGGALVTGIADDSPAAAGGVRVGDVIVAIEQHTVDDVSAMVATLRSYEPGDDVAVTVLRDGSEVICSVALASAVDDDG